MYLFVQGILVFQLLSGGQSWLLVMLLCSLAHGVAHEKMYAKGFAAISLIFLMSLVFRYYQIPMECQQGDKEELLRVRGRIVSFISIRENGVQFLLEDGADGRRIQCFLDKEDWTIGPDFGDEIQMEGTFERPDQKRNPGGFDYRSYLLSKKVGWIFYGDAAPQVVSPAKLHPLVKELVELRRKAMGSLDQKLSTTHGAFAKGLLFGEKGMDEEDEDLFSRVGVAHVLAVSGLHVGVLYGALDRLLRKCNISLVVRLILLGLLLWTYAFWCGFSVSVVRAGGMAMIHHLAQGTRKTYDSINAMALVGSLTMWMNPYVVMTSSFQLSYGAVFAIAVFFSYLSSLMKGQPILVRKLADPIWLSLSVFVFTSPLVAGMFFRMSPLSVVVNLAVVPLAGVALIGLLLSCLADGLGLWWGSSVGFWICDHVIGWMFTVAQWVEKIPWHSVLALGWPGWKIGALYIWMALICGYTYLKPMWARRLALAMILMMVSLPVLEQRWDTTMDVTFLDVGQGDAALVELPGGRTMLVDGGGSGYRNIGEDVVLKALLHGGHRKIDIMVCTHSHVDHKKGLEELLQLVHVSLILVNGLEDHESLGTLRVEAEKQGVSMKSVQAGTVLTLEKGVRLEFLHPDPQRGSENANNTSLVFRLLYGQSSFMFTGDVETAGEMAILDKDVPLTSQVIKIAHHGSDTSSLEAFIQQVSPKYAVISVGEDNRYGHPAKKTLELLEQERVQYYRTDRHGAVKFSTNGEKLTGTSLIKEQP